MNRAYALDPLSYSKLEDLKKNEKKTESGSVIVV
jgi:hypothetical protein